MYQVTAVMKQGEWVDMSDLRPRCCRCRKPLYSDATGELCKHCKRVVTKQVQS